MKKALVPQPEYPRSTILARHLRPGKTDSLILDISEHGFVLGHTVNQVEADIRAAGLERSRIQLRRYQAIVIREMFSRADSTGELRRMLRQRLKGLLARTIAAIEETLDSLERQRMSPTGEILDPEPDARVLTAVVGALEKAFNLLDKLESETQLEPLLDPARLTQFYGLMRKWLEEWVPEDKQEEATAQLVELYQTTYSGKIAPDWFLHPEDILEKLKDGYISVDSEGVVQVVMEVPSE